MKGRTTEMSFQKFSLGEVETIEELTGQTLGVVLATDAPAPSAKLITAFALVLRRRTEPEFTLEQARAIPYDEAIALFAAAMEEDDDPKAAPSLAVSTAGSPASS